MNIERFSNYFREEKIITLFDPIKKKESERMKIISKEKVGEGVFSNVYKVKILLKNGKEIFLTMKEYKKESKRFLNRKTDKEFIEIFNQLKENNVPTFSVFRLNKSKKHQIFMSLENLDENVEIITHHTDLGKSFKSNQKIEEISNKNKFFEQCWQVIKTMHKANLKTHNLDPYFIFYNKKTKAVDIKVCDLDNLRKEDNPDSLKDDYSIFMGVSDSIKSFFENNNLPEGIQTEFTSFLKSKLEPNS
jgi:hypothetical protein